MKHIQPQDVLPASPDMIHDGPKNKVIDDYSDYDDEDGMSLEEIYLELKEDQKRELEGDSSDFEQVNQRKERKEKKGRERQDYAELQTKDPYEVDPCLE